MKNIIKIFAIIGISVLLATGVANSAFASDHRWVKDSNGWCVQDSAGNYLISQWYQSPESGLWYYLNYMGYMKQNCVTPDGYALNEDGAMIACDINSAEYYYMQYLDTVTASAFDAWNYEVEYLIKDFNQDGIEDMLLFEAYEEQYGNGTNVETIYTIQNGRIVLVDEISHPFRWGARNALTKYNENYLINVAEGRIGELVYSINSNLKFVQEIYCTFYADGEIWENSNHIYNGIESYEDIEWGDVVEMNTYEDKFLPANF